MKSYKQCCSEVAIKYGLGKSLVTGHRSVYWEEAAEMYASQTNEKDRTRELEETILDQNREIEKLKKHVKQLKPRRLIDED